MFVLLRKNKGFLALTEMIVVLSVVGILILMAIPTYKGVQERGRRTRSISDMGNILAVACEMHKLDTGVFPSSITQLYSNVSSLARWRGPYTGGRLTPALDAWRTLYTLQGSGSTTVLIHSAGRNKIPESGCLNFININRQTAACSVAGADDVGVYLE